MSTRFAAYSDIMGEGFTLAELVEFQAREGTLFANAENSGSEGCYCEVARWNMESQRFERFAFLKCFGGEYRGEKNSNRGDSVLKATETAARFAAAINSATDRNLCIVHLMPAYSGDRSLAAEATA